MNNFNLKIEIPKVRECPRCKDMAKVNDFRIRPDDTLSVIYICDCGYEDSVLKEVTFV